jgi:hypothetical protein
VSVKSLVYGGLYHNRRRGARRVGDADGYYVDWYEPPLMFLAVGVVLLSCADAFLTLVLLDLGAVEVNAVMARLIEHDIALFAAVKIGLTALGVVVLVVHFSFRLFRRFPVRALLSLCLLGYLALLAHQLTMLSHLLPGGVPVSG